MSQAGDAVIPPTKTERRAADHKGHEAGAASHRLYAEAVKEWQKEASEARKAPLSVTDGQHYTVKHGDTLSDIAVRRLHADHEKVNPHSIAKEEERIRKLNSSDHKSLASKDKKDRDFLNDGWNLKIYDSVHDQKSDKPDKTAPGVGRDAGHGAVDPKAKPDESGKESKAISEAIGKKLSPLDLESGAIPHPGRVSKAPADHIGNEPKLRADGRPEHLVTHEPAAREKPHELPRRPAGSPKADAEDNADLAPPSKAEPKVPERRPAHEARLESEDKKSPDGASPSEKLDRSRFYTHQTDGFSCSAVALAMMHANEETGRPPGPGEIQHFKNVTGTTAHGYRGSLSDMAQQARSQGLEAKAYQYGRFGEQGMNDLDRELAAGHSAVARIINPHTGNPHYIYVAGRDKNGNYEIGDPDRKNNANFGHDRPISRSHLMQMMSGRDGFVAGWT